MMRSGNLQLWNSAFNDHYCTADWTMLEEHPRHKQHLAENGFGSVINCVRLELYREADINLYCDMSSHLL